MKKPKISPTELAKFIAMFDVDDRVDHFEGNCGQLLEPKDIPMGRPELGVPDPSDVAYIRRMYRRMDFRFPGEMAGRTNPHHMIIWEEV